MDQRWDLFVHVSDPLLLHWYALVARVPTNRTRFDVLASDTTPYASAYGMRPHDRARGFWARPAVMADLWVSQRWRKFLQMEMTRKAVVQARYGAFACARLRDQFPGLFAAADDDGAAAGGGAVTWELVRLSIVTEYIDPLYGPRLAKPDKKSDTAAFAVWSHRGVCGAPKATGHDTYTEVHRVDDEGFVHREGDISIALINCDKVWSSEPASCTGY